MQDRTSLYIDGQWVASTGKGTIEVVNPATEQVIARVAEGTAGDVERAVAAARAAFDGWAATPVAERADILARVAAGLEARGDEIAATITDEVGVPLKLSRLVQVGSPVGIFKSMAKLAPSYQWERTIRNSLVVREAIGVVACITPWNYPLHQVAAKVAPALAAGCTVVLKPSEVAPSSAFILAEVLHDAGLPKGVFNLVTGYGPVVGEALAEHEDVDMVSFTGSTLAGKRVAAVAAGTIKKVALELGGKSAAIILDDADLETAIKGTFGACYINSGQTCTAHTRMLVPESRYAEAAEIAARVAEAWVVGDPRGEKTRLGPLASEAQRTRVRAYIERGVAEGAQLLTGGTEAPEGLDTGYYVRPTVLGRVDPDATVAREEIFGPVMAILTYRDEDEAVRIANHSIYGLSGGVWSNDLERAKRVAKRMRTGMVDINGGPFNPLAPFGGYKQSGLGREFGEFGLEEFLEVKSIQLPVAK